MAGSSGAPGFHSRHAWLPAVLPAGARRFRVADCELAQTLALAGGELVDAAPDVEIGPARSLRGDGGFAVVTLESEQDEGRPRLVRAAARAARSLGVRGLAAAARRRVRERGYDDVEVLLWDLEKRQALERSHARTARGMASHFPLGALVVGRRSHPAPTFFEAAANAARAHVPAFEPGAPHARVSGMAVGAADAAILRVAVGPAAGQLEAQRTSLAALRTAPPEVTGRIPRILAHGKVGLADWSLEERVPGAPAPAIPSDRLLQECVAFLASLFGAERGRQQRKTLSADADVVAAACDAGRGARVRTMAARAEAALADLPRGFAHGDFWTENLLANGEALAGVVDWDRAGGGRLPLLDLFHLLLRVEARRRRIQVGRALVQHLLPMLEGGGSAALRSLSRAVGLEPDRVPLASLLVAYWLDWVAYELRAYADRGREQRPVWVRENVDVVLRGLVEKGV